MDRNMRRGHDAAFKARVALDALKGEPNFRASMVFMPIKFVSGVRGFWMNCPMYFPIVAGSRTKRMKR